MRRGALLIAATQAAATSPAPTPGLQYYIVNDANNRYALGGGSKVTPGSAKEAGYRTADAFAADANYYGRAKWVFKKQPQFNGKEVYIIENAQTGRWLLLDSTSDDVSGSRGNHEGGWVGAPPARMADADYYHKALWKLDLLNGKWAGKYIIEHALTGRYLLGFGSKVDEADRSGKEGSYGTKMVGTDLNYYGHAVWKMDPPFGTCGQRSCGCWGDPHCSSFDNRYFDWYGECDYTFLRDDRPPPDATPFEVQIRNSDPSPVGHGYVTMITDVAITLPNGDQLFLNRDPTCLYGPDGAKSIPAWATGRTMFPDFEPNNTLNGAPLSIPHSGEGYEVKWYPNTMPNYPVWKPAGRAVGIEIASLGVTLVWTMCNRIEATLSAGSPLHTHTAGMCGNSNCDAGDDAHIPDQLLPSKFPTQQCTELKPPPPVLPKPPCDNAEALALCGKIQEELAACHAAVDPAPFFDHCMVDACAMPELLPAAEINIQAYESDCCDAGVPVGGGCPPWKPQEETPSISGDPFTVYNGKRTQFWLPLEGATPLLAYADVSLRGAVTTAGVAGDAQQWFRSFAVRVRGEEALAVAVAADAAAWRALPAAAADEAEVDVAVELPTTAAAPRSATAGDELKMLSVTVDGASVRVMGELRAANGTLGVTVSKGRTEQVAVASPGLAFKMWGAVAKKAGAAAGLAHLDITFTNINASACTGMLPEIWGVQPVSEQTSRFLTPPTR